MTITVDISREEDSIYKAVNMTLTDVLVIEPKSIESAIVILGEALTYNGTEQAQLHLVRIKRRHVAW